MTVDPLYANANKRSQPQQIEGASPAPPATSNQMAIKHDYSGMRAALYDAYMYCKNERELSNQILGTNIGGDQNNIGDGEGFDMTRPDDKSQISEPPDLFDLSHIPDKSSPPDADSGALDEPDSNLIL